MFERAQVILFDLDGTLTDSAPDLTLAVDIMMGQLGLPTRGEQKVRQWVGNGADNLIRRALADNIEGNAPEHLVAKARPLFKAAYAENLCVNTRLYPGVLEGLEALRAMGFRLACITNKPAEFALPLLEKIGIAAYFETVVGGECVAHKKPAPDALLLAAQRLGVDIGRTLMVGDSLNDVGAARHAGCPVVAVSYGYNHGQDIHEAKPDAVIDSLAELGALLNRAIRAHTEKPPEIPTVRSDFRWRS